MNEKLTVVIHNAAFETMFFYALGCVPQCKIYDTLAAAQMTLKNETEFRKLSDSGLKKLVPEILGVDLPSFDDVTNGKNFDEIYKDCDEGYITLTLLPRRKTLWFKVSELNKLCDAIKKYGTKTNTFFGVGLRKKYCRIIFAAEIVIF